jgi:hypothetical protein
MRPTTNTDDNVQWWEQWQRGSVGTVHVVSQKTLADRRTCEQQ